MRIGNISVLEWHPVGPIKNSWNNGNALILLAGFCSGWILGQAVYALLHGSITIAHSQHFCRGSERQQIMSNFL